jgi:hypothetical protein
VNRQNTFPLAAENKPWVGLNMEALAWTSQIIQADPALLIVNTYIQRVEVPLVPKFHPMCFLFKN